MAWHKRHVQPIDTRIIVRFERYDYLWRSPAPLFHPYLNQQIQFPIRMSSKIGECVGPNLLDMVDYKEEMIECEVNGKIHERKTQRLLLRDPSTLFCKPDSKQFRDIKDKNAKADAKLRSALKRAVTTKGMAVGEVDEYTRILKYSSVSISRIVFIQCCGMRGGVTSAVQYIQQKAAEAWSQDIERSKALFEAVMRENEGVLIEDLPEALFPESTISQQVESEILREVCTWLGVDPDMSVDRPMGRPTAKHTREGGESDQGEVIQLTISETHELSGRVIQDFSSFRKDTLLESLSVLKLAELLGQLRQANLEHDADLLEAYLDAVHESWHEQVTEQLNEVPSAHAGAPDPYDVLGLQRGCTEEELKKAYRRVIQGVHEDKSGSRYLSQLVNEARLKIQEDIKHGR